MMQDSFKAQGLRKKLVQTLRTKGITDERVLAAIGKVQRHRFLDSGFFEHAYQDKAFPIGEGQTISQPYTVAFQTQALQVKPGARILEIGTGSGYQASVLCELGVDLFSIEYIKKLQERAMIVMAELGYHAHFYHGDGSLGLGAFAPYDGIIVTAGAPSVPDSLMQQLAIGGRLVIPVGQLNSSQMLIITRQPDGSFTQEAHGQFAFVPLVGKQGW